MEYYAAKRMKELLCNSMDGAGEHYTKWSKPGDERLIPYDFAYKGNLINKTNKQTSEQNKTRDMEINNKLTVTRVEEGEE